VYKRVNTFVDFRTELVKGSSKRAGEELKQGSLKKQKVDDNKETTELKELMKIIPDEEEVAIDAIPLAVKSLKIVDWKIHKEGKKSYYQIIRANGNSKMYMVFNRMLKEFDREDLEDLYSLGMITTKSGRKITKNIDDITIAEHMEYKAEMRRGLRKYTRNSGLTTLGGIISMENMHQPDKLATNDYFPLILTCFKPPQPRTDDIHKPLGNKPNDYYLFTPQSHYETEEVSSDEDVDEWLNEELSKCMTGEDKEEEKDALIDILKTADDHPSLVPLLYLAYLQDHDDIVSLCCLLNRKGEGGGEYGFFDFFKVYTSSLKRTEWCDDLLSK
nr:hypothetical protein [Tanacetum cinerariifolium]